MKSPEFRPYKNARFVRDIILIALLLGLPFTLRAGVEYGRQSVSPMPTSSPTSTDFSSCSDLEKLTVSGAAKDLYGNASVKTSCRHELSTDNFYFVIQPGTDDTSH
ncbi:hypothetical protein M1403_00440 [Patescibacteria group bacterium]|nr:hypothetical protein [Patescibacteria group bacterium]